MLGWLIKRLIGMLIVGVVSAAVGAVIAYTVHEIITKSRLPQLIRNALKKNPSEQSKQLLAKAFEARIKEINANTITLEALANTGRKSDDVEIKITGDSVDAALKQDMIISVGL